MKPLEQTARHHGVPIPDDVVAELIAERKRRGMTKHELAMLLGVRVAHVSRMERGGHTPRWELFERWARVLGFEVTVGVEKNGTTPCIER